MKDITKKVVILENLSSPYVHQAIIVMRDYNPKLESRAILEAERIVNAYLDNVKISNGKVIKPRRHSSRFFVCFAFIAITGLAVLAAMHFR